MTTSSFTLGTILITLGVPSIIGYSQTVFPETPPLLQRVANPFKSQGLDIELPDIDDVFGRIRQVSPLANSVINQENNNRGFAGLEENRAGKLKWKRVESNNRATVHQIERLDNFQGLSAPMLRFRSTIEGPCVGEFFGKFILDLKERKKWDAQIKDVYELYPLADTDSANIAMGFGQYGDCSQLGIGYCQTLASMGVTTREQMFLYGLQDFVDGSYVLWGTEMNKKYDHLLPLGERHTRATSHLFTATLTPTSEESFDVEYCLQLDIGGNIPKFLTTPVMIDTVKSLFSTAKSEFGAAGEGGALDIFLHEQSMHDGLADRLMLLVSP
jgi:hypothetical protein